MENVGVYWTCCEYHKQILQKGGPTMTMMNFVRNMTLMTAPSAFVRLR